MSNVCTNGTGTGINGFVYSYMESLLTYGEAVGEMVLSRDGKMTILKNIRKMKNFLRMLLLKTSRQLRWQIFTAAF